MRNLKRALSLTLASVMLLGMMVVGSSAAGYPDVSEEENIEAIEVLQAVGVMGGDENGNFNPDDYVTREQMAVIMAQLLKLDYNYYKGTNPFSDVPEWAAPYVAACAANGVTAGIGGGLYGSKQNIQAVQAALMMLKALGYFQYSGDYGDSYVLATVKQGSEIGLFDGIDSNSDSALTRNQVAQMALNALKSNMVSFTGDPGATIPTASGDVVIGYKAEYTFRSGTDRKYFAISGQGNTTDGTTNQAYIQLGEQLYDGDLRLNDSTYDDFGRPARYWEYDGTAVGTYAKKELVQETYTAKVTGKMLYDLLGKDLVNLIDGSDSRTRYTLSVTIDGNDDNATHTKVFGKSALSRTNTDAVGGTGNGVLTEVYVDNTARTIDIAIINTYLAIADNDYNEKKDEVSLNIYNLDKDGSLYFKDYKRDGEDDDWRDAENPLKASGEDFNVADVKKDDKFLVTVAAGEIKSVVAPEILTEQTITSHKTHDYVVAGTQYDYTTTAQYDVEVMDSFNSDDMKEVTYNIVLDKYGYLIGVEKNEAVNQYVFLAGVDDEFSHLSQKNVRANVIFLDGSMETITINTKKSVLRYDANGNTEDTSDGHADDVYIADAGTGHPRRPSQAHMWCTYSVDSDGIYTLKAVAGVTSTTNKVKVAQSSMDANDATTPVADQVTINSKNISLAGSGTFTRVHGNADTVYINTTALENVDVTATDKRMIVDDVDSVTTGVTNVDMTVKNISDSGSYGAPKDEIYTLYNDKGVIIAVVTLNAEDNATTAHYAYINSSDIHHRDQDGDKYIWYREAIVDGEFVMLKEVDEDHESTYLDKLTRGEWYEIKYNANGEVKGFYKVDYAANDSTVPDGSETGNPKLPNANTKKQVGTPDIPGVEYSLNNGWDKTLILKANYKTTKPELKTEGQILYTGNTANEGVYVSPDAKIVVYTKDYKDYRTFTGNQLETALNSLVNKKAFNGYVNAVVDKNGWATVVILDEKNMDAPDTYSITFTGDTNRVTFADGSAIAPITGINKGDTKSFSLKAKTGSVLTSVTVNGTPLTPDATGKYTITNITDSITVTINAEKDGDAYDGTIVVDISTPASTKATWTGAAKPTYDEMYNAVLAKLLSAGYNADGLEDSSDGSSSIEFKATKRNGINIASANQPTFTLTYDGALTEIREVSTQDALTAALSDAGFSGKIKLATNATVTSAPSKDIEVAAGSTLTLNTSAATALTEDITGAGNVTVGGSGSVTDGDKIAVSGKVTLGANIDKLTAATGDVDVTGDFTIGGALTMATGKTLTITDGKTLSVTGAATIPGTVTGTGSTGATLELKGNDTVGTITDKVNLTNTSGTLTINGAATPKALTHTAGKITVAAAGSLTLPGAVTIAADGMEINGTVTAGGDLTISGANVSVKATGTLDLKGNNLVGTTGAKLGVAGGAKINNISGAKFFDLTGAAVTANITVPNDSSVSTYDYGTTYGSGGDTGWKAAA